MRIIKCTSPSNLTSLSISSYPIAQVVQGRFIATQLSHEGVDCKGVTYDLHGPIRPILEEALIAITPMT